MPLSSLDLAEFIVAHPVDDAARAAAATAILDTLAVIAAGSGEDAVAHLAATIEPSTGHHAKPGFDTGARYRPEDASLLYGTAAHALDYDDVSMLAICHPSAPVLAALLAAADWTSLTGRVLCDAHAIGTEVMIRIGQAIGFRHYDLGFHATATMGVFGATAALSRLHRLPTEATATALAIAASLSSGLRLNFGTMIKPTHVGIAAANALRAVAWAKSGVDATRRDLFAAGGVLETFSGGTQATWPDTIRLGTPFAIVSPGFERKRYSCCYLLHKIIALGVEAAGAGLKLDEVARLRVEMPVGGIRPLIYPRPDTGREAMFSGPYALLAAIDDGDIGFGSFTDAAVARAELRARFDDVTIAEVGDRPLTAEEIGAAPVRLEMHLRDGSVRRLERHAAPGSPGDPMTDAELRAKWVDCFARARLGGRPHHADALYDEARELLRAGPLGDWLWSLWHEIGGGRETARLSRVMRMSA